MLDRNTQGIRIIFSSWREEITVDLAERIVLIYSLGHQNTDANLSLGQLKHNDLVKARFLEEVYRRTGFDMYLASTERKVRSAAQYSRRDDRWVDGSDDRSPEPEGSDHFIKSKLTDLTNSNALPPLKGKNCFWMSVQMKRP
ncbi:hypothetical protein K432DRAFT_410664 [Lepidopterella palustris CBS 459.81]|uniref:Uncharacterized protein n=1 Tax=Lepidopterella palustris CBS 459.81 TaxID=1314670 RepID=A0A8E2DXE5_9PEZI|nr:hypothetical protein K432DRAFT_410664 [Lepidopterella palustris CBS 459.81]